MKNIEYTFSVWAPLKNEMILHLVHPREEKLAMQKGADGYFTLKVPGVCAGTQYYFIPEGETDTPDPRSLYQPNGVHGASEIVDHHDYDWQDTDWKGLPFKDLVMYELHIGSFTEEGTFEAAIPLLDDLADTGINAIELMPVNQFPGVRNWGYDGVFMYAVQNSYGGPSGLKKLVDACHQKGIAVFLDAVYNHLGPEGNYLGRFGPYFTGKYHTPWGDALNFDGEYSDEVKRFFRDNLLYWYTHFHVDGIRLDAVHEVYDRNAHHFWAGCHEAVQLLQQQLGRTLYLVAESDLNSPHVVKAPAAGGWGFHAQWLDDFHHALYVLVHPDGKKHYEDFGRMQQLAKAFKEGFVHSGEYVSFRKRSHGASSAGIPGDRFVVFSQNHDIVGNRPGGERLSSLISFEQQQLAAAAVLLSPYVPMLFMGEEYGEEAPFYFFADHSEEHLRESLREGRKTEFAAFHWDKEPPDALAEEVFLQCKLQWQKRREGKHRRLLQWYKALIRLRRDHPLLSNLDKNNIYVSCMEERGLVIQRQDDRGIRQLICLFNFSDEPLAYTPTNTILWRKILDGADEAVSSKPLPGTTCITVPPFGVQVYESC